MIEHLSNIYRKSIDQPTTSSLRGLEAREIWVRDQIGDGIIEFWVDAESEIFDFRVLDGILDI